MASFHLWLEVLSYTKALFEGITLGADVRKANDKTVREAQHRLRIFGYDPGPETGKMDIKTINALKQFQDDHGDQVSGNAPQNADKSQLAMAESPAADRIAFA